MYQTGQEKPGIQTSLHLGNFALFCFIKLWFVQTKCEESESRSKIQGDIVSTILKLTGFSDQVQLENSQTKGKILPQAFTQNKRMLEFVTHVQLNV